MYDFMVLLLFVFDIIQLLGFLNLGAVRSGFNRRFISALGWLMRFDLLLIDLFAKGDAF